MPDFNNPLSTQAYLALLSSIVENNQSTLKMLEGVTPLTNLPTNAKRWNPANARWENWNGSVWAELTALFEMKVRNSDQLNGQTEGFYRNAGNMNAGTLPTARIASNTISLAQMADIATASFLGRNTAGTGDPQVLSATTVRSMLNIENGATADMTSSEVLAALLPVDGPGSGLNSDFVDNYHAADLLARNNHTGTQLLSTISNAGSLAALNQVPASSITQLEMGANSVGQSEIKTTYQEVSHFVGPGASGSIYFTASSGAFTLGHTSHSNVPSPKLTTTTGLLRRREAPDATPVARWLLSTANEEAATYTFYSRLYYINSSPPYDLGFGNIPLFIFFVRDNVTGKVVSISASTEAPWHYNGPTDITPSGYLPDGTPFKKMRAIEHELIQSNKNIKDELKGANRVATQNRLKNDKIVSFEIDQVMKNADMPLIPHPFGGDLTGKTIGVVNPQSSICEALLLTHERGESISDLFYAEDITLTESVSNQGFDASVKCFDAQWKNTI